MKSTRQLFMFALVLVLAFTVTACGSKPDVKQGQGSSTGGGNSPAASAGASSPSPSAGTAKTWTKAPEMTIDSKKTYQAKFDTSKGSFTIDLFAKEAPITVNNFVFLAEQKFYDGVTFHRIIQSFMIQTGDPKGTGTGGPGYTIQDELKTPYKYEPGIVAMANTGQKNSGGSQFFICTEEGSDSLNRNPNYTIFGKVSEGMDTVKKIAATPVEMMPGSNDRSPSKPKEKVTINSIKITVK